MRTKLFLTIGAVAAAAVSVFAVPATAAPTGPPPGTAAASAVRWGACPADIALPGVPPEVQPTLQCGAITVPLDYRNPDGRTIRVAISRLPSTKPAERRGILLTNPGGPGVSGLSFPAALAVAGLPQSVLDSYDIIGMDPRGVGHSTPFSCEFTPAQMARGAFSDYAYDSADVVREAAYARTIARQCASSSTAALLPHLTTPNTARDLDSIRTALGERKAPYFGSSYGSYLGAVYATLFPTTSDRVVLDSNLGPGGYDVLAMRRFAQGMEDRFPDFAAFVAAHPEYGLGTTLRQVTTKYHQLVAKLDRKPVSGIDGDLFRSFTFSFIYGDATFGPVAEVWKAANTGAPTLPIPVEGDPVAADNSASARLAVICGDSWWPTDVGTYQRTAAVDRGLTPLLGGSTGNIGPCAYWPHPADMEPRVTITSRGPANVLMVQNEREPGTALVGARQLRQAFGARAVMVTADAGGHGVYPFIHNSCVDDAATTFLVTGTRPARDLACPAEASTPSTPSTPASP